MGNKVVVSTCASVVVTGLLSLNLCDVNCAVSKVAVGSNGAVESAEAAAIDHSSHSSEATHQNHAAGEDSKSGHSCLALAHPDHSLKQDATLLQSFGPAVSFEEVDQPVVSNPPRGRYDHSPPGVRPAPDSFLRPLRI